MSAGSAFLPSPLSRASPSILPAAPPSFSPASRASTRRPRSTTTLSSIATFGPADGAVARKGSAMWPVESAR